MLLEEEDSGGQGEMEKNEDIGSHVRGKSISLPLVRLCVLVVPALPPGRHIPSAAAWCQDLLIPWHVASCHGAPRV